MKDSSWTGTFSDSIELSGDTEGTASIHGDLSFTVRNPDPKGITTATLIVPTPPFVNAVFGTFRCSFTSYAREKILPLADGSGETVGAGPQTCSGNAVGNFVGEYNPSTNTIKITLWEPFITQASGSYTLGQGQPDQETTPYSVNNAVPAGLGNPPPAYMVPPSMQNPPEYPGVFLPFVGPGATVMLDLNNLGSQQASNSDSTTGDPFTYTETATWTFNLVPPKYTIKLQLGTGDLDPTGVATTKVTITVLENGNYSQSRDVDITVCTEFGGLGDDTDGHGTHDPSVGDPCDPRSRPTGSIDDQTSYPVTETTDGTGTITVQYTSPVDPSTGKCYISGTDDVKGVVDDLTITDKTSITDKQTVKTWVKGLRLMPQGALYDFGPQPMHPGEFYGTTDTIDAIQSIANAFNVAQMACKNGDNPNYQNNQGQNLSTPNGPKILHISAMSLPWGGLNDIGHGTYGTVWNPPHITHHNGKVVDFPIGDLTQQGGDVSAWDTDRIILLWLVIGRSPSFGTWGKLTEGGDLNATLKTPGTHFHVNFSS